VKSKIGETTFETSFLNRNVRGYMLGLFLCCSVVLCYSNCHFGLITNPHIKENIMKEEVLKVLEMVRPGLQADGGDVELVEVTDDGVVKVRLKGACGSCPMSTMTLKMGIERAMKEQVPGVKEVIGV
jgi:Fe-S cluster biogenesis protein NfuA